MERAVLIVGQDTTGVLGAIQRETATIAAEQTDDIAARIELQVGAPSESLRIEHPFHGKIDVRQAEEMLVEHLEGHGLGNGGHLDLRLLQHGVKLPAVANKDPQGLWVALALDDQMAQIEGFVDNDVPTVKVAQGAQLQHGARRPGHLQLPQILVIVATHKSPETAPFPEHVANALHADLVVQHLVVVDLLGNHAE